MFDFISKRNSNTTRWAASPIKIFHISTWQPYRLLSLDLFLLGSASCSCTCAIQPLVHFEPFNHCPLLQSQTAESWERFHVYAEVCPHPAHYWTHSSAITLIKLTMCVGERVLSCVWTRGKGLRVCMRVSILVPWELERHAGLAELSCI